MFLILTATTTKFVLSINSFMQIERISCHVLKNKVAQKQSFFGFDFQVSSRRRRRSFRNLFLCFFSLVEKDPEKLLFCFQRISVCGLSL
jgi:hypothetical protein